MNVEYPHASRAHGPTATSSAESGMRDAPTSQTQLRTDFKSTDDPHSVYRVKRRLMEMMTKGMTADSLL